MTTEQNRDATEYMESHYKMVWCTMCDQHKPMSEDYCGPDDRCWEPFYSDVVRDIDVDGPVCPDCVAEHLVFDPLEGYCLLKSSVAALGTDLPTAVVECK